MKVLILAIVAAALALVVFASSWEQRALSAAVTSRAATVAASQGPTIVGDAAAVAPCSARNGSLTLIGAVASSAAEVANWVENAAYPDAPQLRNSVFRSFPPSTPIFVCYFSGSWSPPIGATGPAGSAGVQPIPTLDLTVHDRERMFVTITGEAVGPLTIAPSAFLPIARPGGRF